MEVRFVFGELADAGPGTLAGGAHDAEDLLQLVFVGGAGEEGTTGVHFGHDAAGGPDVDGGVVGAGAEKDVGSSIPESYDFVGEGIDGDAKCSGQTKICQFELAFVVDQKVLGFEISM